MASTGADPGGVRWVRTNPPQALYNITSVTAATELYLSTVATDLQSIYFYDTFHLRMPLLPPSQ